MQSALHGYLARQRLHFVDSGAVIETPPCGSPYRVVLHAVAIDGFYDTSPEVVAGVLLTSLRRSASLGARSVALAALGTGYGRLSLAGFAEALKTVMAAPLPPLEQVVLGVRSQADAEKLLALVPALGAT